MCKVVNRHQGLTEKYRGSGSWHANALQRRSSSPDLSVVVSQALYMGVPVLDAAALLPLMWLSRLAVQIPQLVFSRTKEPLLTAQNHMWCSRRGECYFACV